MSIPIVTNRAPAPQQVTKVNELVRFSLRTASELVDRSTIAVHIGAGPIFYEGDVLPEDLTDKRFFLDSIAGPTTVEPTRSIELDGSLKLAKTTLGNQNALYFFGGLQAPAEPDAVIMAEFTLKLAETDVIPDGDFTGVMFGFMINDTGVSVRFFMDGVGGRWIEVFDAGYTSANRINYPTSEYLANYDWDQSKEHTYKLLWIPKLDIMRLFVSSGMDVEDYDVLLVDGKVSDFSPLPSDEIRDEQPWAFFGHGFPDARSTSYWYNAYLFNISSAAIWEGIHAGEHEGFVITDNQTLYDGSARPRDVDQTWMILPDSFDDIEGNESVDDASLLLECLNEDASYGFYRREEKLDANATVVDFDIWGELISREAGIESSGIEIYLDDGTKLIRLAFLADEFGTNYVGIQTGTDPAALTSYSAEVFSWQVRRSYRLVYRSGEDVQLRIIEVADEGYDETLLLSVAYADLPASSMPGPGIGFLKNGNTGKTGVRMRVGRVRYYTNSRVMDPDDLTEWPRSGTGTTVVTDGILKLISTAGGSYYAYRDDSVLSEVSGFSLEFRGRVNSYTVDGEDNPIRSNTGVGVRIQDGGDLILLVFADMGPPNGKIIFLSRTNDLDQDLLDIRAGKEWMTELYAVVDWSEFHIYRFEKTLGGKIALFIDDNITPSIEFETSGFEFGSFPSLDRYIGLGQVSPGYSESEWQYLRCSVSEGYDASAFPVLSENEVLARFGHAVDIIVEAADDS